MRQIIRKQYPMTLGRKLLSFVALSFAVCLVTGMARGPGGNPPDNSEVCRQLVNQAISDIEATYNRRSLQGFISLLDKDYEARLKFNDKIQSHFTAVKELEIRFVTDTVLTGRNKISVMLHWVKKTVDNGGLFSKSEGSSQFVFKKYPEGLKLFYFRGDNPFF